MAGAAAPELGRLNALLADLAERARSALIRIRPEPAAATGEGRGSHQHARPGVAGFVINPDGTALTVAHGLPSGERIEVELADGRRIRARVLGRDVQADLAALRLEAPGDFPALPLGDSDRLRVGELVLALGHPFGLEHAVSFGIVSRKGPPPTGGVPGFDFIQTDAAINPGNSGGPLVNMAGEVVGVTSWAARSGSMGVAIPANLVKLLLPQLVTQERREERR